MASPTPPAPPDGRVTSFLFMRRGIGIIGIALPFALVIIHSAIAGSLSLGNSVSGYYYTDMRNVFVGSMCAIGVFMFCYRFSPVDNVLTNLAGLLALGVALCPTSPLHPTHNARIAGVFHYVFAGSLFFLLALFCLWRFPMLDPGMTEASPRKLTRNKIYRTCGVIILLGLALAGIADTVFPRSAVTEMHLLFWCEAVMIIAFGVSWLFKGNTLLKG